MPPAASDRTSPDQPIRSSKSAYARRLLIGWLIIVALITMGAITFHREQETYLRKKAEGDMTTIAQLKVEQIEAWLSDLYADANNLGANPDFLAKVAAWRQSGATQDRAAVEMSLRHAALFHPERQLAIVDRQSTVLLVGTAHAWDLRDYARRAIASAFSADSLALIDLHQDSEDADPHLGLAIPLRLAGTTTEDRPLALVMRVDASAFLYPLIAKWPIDSVSHETLLVRREGDEVLFLNDLRFDPDAALKRRLQLAGGREPAALAVQGIVGVVEGPDYLGNQVLAAIIPVPDTPWFLIAKVGTSEVFASWRFRSASIIVVAVLASLGGGAITYSTWQSAVNEEYQRKLKAEVRLGESEARFEQLVEAAPDPVFIENDGRFVYVNPAAAKLFGADDPGMLVGRPSADMAPREPVVPAGENIGRDAGLDGYVPHFATVFRRLDGSEIAVDVSRVPFDFDGRPSELVFAQDITDRIRAQEQTVALNDSLTERVRQRTLALESANRELEAFVYSASHDLRAPLRAIDGFAGILAGEYAEQLDTEGQRLIHIIRTSAKDMDRLISDLLLLSRTSRAEMQLERVDMAALAQQAWQTAASPEIRANYELEIEPLPPASGDRALLRQVWLNLLDNAIKYTASKPLRQIRVGSHQEPGESVYYVSDSGVGFDPRHAGKLFGVFQRLHSSTEFTGNGIGLALVQRIITRHGGRVWADSQLGEGATFYFTLPEGVE